VLPVDVVVADKVNYIYWNIYWSLHSI
jgi:hypothetical protein